MTLPGTSRYGRRKLPNGKPNPEYMKEYSRINGEKIHRQGREWVQNHLELNRRRAREWYWSNKERAIERIRKWQKEHPEKRRASRKLYLSNPENKSRNDASKLKWLRTHPHDRHQILAKSESKRKRGLSTNIILGEPFPNSHLHHLRPNIAIYIPNSIHRSMYHNIWTGQNMAEINSRAWEFYEAKGEILPI